MRLSSQARILFNPKRFEIATILYATGPKPLHRLREETGLTWGDLDSNLRYMARHGLIELRRVPTPQGPRTIARLTVGGVQAYEELAAYLEAVLEARRRAPDTPEGPRRQA